MTIDLSLLTLTEEVLHGDRSTVVRPKVVVVQQPTVDLSLIGYLAYDVGTKGPRIRMSALASLPDSARKI